MGWVGAVDLIQRAARGLVFNIAGTLVPMKSLRPAFSHSTLPTTVNSSSALTNGTPSFIHRLRLACDRLKLPFHAGKRVFRASSAPTLGAELDGARGILCHAREKVQSLFFAVLSLLVCSRWSVSTLQHCMGLCTSAPGCRLDSLSFKKSTARSGHEPVFAPRSDPVAELLVAVLLVPLACAPPSPDCSLHRRVACRSGSVEGVCFGSQHCSTGAIVT